MVNRRLVRARYFVRHMDDIKARLTGSLWYTKGDGAKGFNQVELNVTVAGGLTDGQGRHVSSLCSEQWLS